MPRIAAPMALALLAATTTIAMAAQPDTQSSTPTAPAETQDKAAQQAAPAMRVYIDPETGAFTDKPVTEEQRQAAAAEAARFRQDDKDVRVVRHADGSTTAYLDGRFEQSTVVTAGANGKLKTYCADTEHAQQGQHSHDPAATEAPTEQEVR